VNNLDAALQRGRIRHGAVEIRKGERR